MPNRIGYCDDCGDDIYDNDAYVTGSPMLRNGGLVYCASCIKKESLSMAQIMHHNPAVIVPEAVAAGKAIAGTKAARRVRGKATKKAKKVAGKVKSRIPGQKLAKKVTGKIPLINPATTREEWELALRDDKKMLSEYKKALKKLKSGKKVENLTIENAELAIDMYKKVIENKKKVIDKLMKKNPRTKSQIKSNVKTHLRFANEQYKKGDIQFAREHLNRALGAMESLTFKESDDLLRDYYEIHDKLYLDNPKQKGKKKNIKQKLLDDKSIRNRIDFLYAIGEDVQGKNNYWIDARYENAVERLPEKYLRQTIKYIKEEMNRPNPKLPYITEKDFKILKEHWAGKKHTIIARKFGVSKKYVDDLILQTAPGYLTLPKGNPKLTYAKGTIPSNIEQIQPYKKILKNFKDQYGAKKGKSYFYAWLRGTEPMGKVSKAEPAGMWKNPKKKGYAWYRVTGLSPSGGGYIDDREYLTEEPTGKTDSVGFYKVRGYKVIKEKSKKNPKANQHLPPISYYCRKCKKRHKKGSKIWEQHKRYVQVRTPKKKSRIIPNQKITQKESSSKWTQKTPKARTTLLKKAGYVPKTIKRYKAMNWRKLPKTTKHKITNIVGFGSPVQFKRPKREGYPKNSRLKNPTTATTTNYGYIPSKKPFIHNVFEELKEKRLGFDNSLKGIKQQAKKLGDKRNKIMLVDKEIGYYIPKGYFIKPVKKKRKILKNPLLVE